MGEGEGSERFIQTVHGRGYRFAAGVETLDGGEAAAATVASDPIPSPPAQASLAVLPFSDLSPGRDQGWFCEGVAEELIATLSEVRGLRVVSRASTSQFRDQDPRSIGERLRVAMLLTGSVRTAGNCLRITTQLVQVSDGSVVASSRYDREMEDIFAMQEAIARWVIEAVEGRFGGRVTPPQLRRPTASVEAYHLYLKGRYHEKRRTPSALHEALRCFEQAVAVDPGFAEGYVGQAVNVLLDRPSEAIENRGYVGAHLARAGRAEEARAILAEMVELRSSFHASKVFEALIHAHLGEVDQALDLLESSLEDGAPRLVWIGVRPIFDPLREQPRVQRILDRMGLPNVRASAAPRR